MATSRGLASVMVGTAWWPAMGRAAGTGSRQPTLNHKHKAEIGDRKRQEDFGSEGHLQQHTSSSKTAPSKPPQAVSPVGDQVFKYGETVGGILIHSALPGRPKGVILP